MIQEAFCTLLGSYNIICGLTSRCPLVPFLVASGTKEIQDVLQVGTFVIWFFWYCLKTEPVLCGLTKELELVILVRCGPLKGGCFLDGSWLICISNLSTTVRTARGSAVVPAGAFRLAMTAMYDTDLVS